VIVKSRTDVNAADDSTLTNALDISLQGVAPNIATELRASLKIDWTRSFDKHLRTTVTVATDAVEAYPLWVQFE
jgi:hypothetical protein